MLRKWTSWILDIQEKQENNGVGDISSVFQRHCQCHWFDNVFEIKTKYHRLRCFLVFLEYRESKMSIFGICFILYFLKLSAFRGF